MSSPLPPTPTDDPGRRGSAPALVARAVRAAARTQLDRVVADIGRWVDQDSPSGCAVELDRLAADIAATAESSGFAAELVPAPGGRHVHACLTGSGRGRVALLCHHDTVFPVGTAAARPFRVSAGLLQGPGVADMKAGIATALHAARLLRSVTDRFGVLELVSVPDEETRVTAPATLDRLDGFDAVLCMECGRPDGAVVTARKGALWARLGATGAAAHAGVDPHQGANAIVALCAEALRLAALDGARPGLTFQVARIRGGESVNSVPESAWLDVDVRARTAADLSWAAERISATSTHRGVALTVETSGVVPPMPASASGSLSSMACSIARSLGHDLPLVTTGGVSDGCWTAAAGLPTLDGLGPVGERDHSPAERVQLDSIPGRCGIIAGLIAAVEEGQ